MITVILLRMLALLFELGAVGLTITGMHKDKNNELNNEAKISILEAIILFLWTSILCTTLSNTIK